MPFWRREEAVHEKLAREGGLRTPSGRSLQPSRLRENLVGIHGVHRPREWDFVGTAVAPGLADDRLVFVVLSDGALLIEEGAGGEIEPLAGAVEGQVELPCRVVAVRKDGDRWAVAANAIEARELPALPGDELTFTRDGANRTLVIDGVEVAESVPALEQLAVERYDAFVLEAERLDGDLWEVRISPL